MEPWHTICPSPDLTQRPIAVFRGDGRESGKSNYRTFLAHGLIVPAGAFSLWMIFRQAIARARSKRSCVFALFFFAMARLSSSALGNSAGFQLRPAA